MSDHVWTILPSERSAAPEPRSVADVEGLFSFVQQRLFDGSKVAAKDRIDLKALSAHTGTTYKQRELISQEVFESVRVIHEVAVLGAPTEAD